MNLSYKLCVVSFLLLFFGCRKEKLTFNYSPNDTYDLNHVLYLDGKSCFIDEEYKILRCYAILDSSDFNPYVKHQEEHEIYFEGKKLVNKSNNNLGKIVYKKAYKVKILIGGKQQDFDLYFTNLPLVHIVTNSSIASEPKTYGKIFTVDQNQNTFDTPISIELRGEAILFRPKKSFGFITTTSVNSDNKESQSLLGLNRGDKWFINAAYDDKFRLRNEINFKLWKLITRDSVPVLQPQMVELFHNNKLLGLYHFSPDYSEELLQINSQSELYQARSDVKYLSVENEPYSTYWSGWEQLIPDPKVEIRWNQLSYLYNLIVNGSDDQIRNELEELISIESLVDYFVFLQAIEGPDNLDKNYFFYREDFYSKFIVLPWDLDVSYGRNHTGKPFNGYGATINNLFMRLFETNVGDFKTLFKTRWFELRSTYFSESSLKNLVQNSLDQILVSDIMYHENLRWNQNLNLEAERDYIYNRITNNLIWQDNWISNF